MVRIRCMADLKEILSGPDLRTSFPRAFFIPQFNPAGEIASSSCRQALCPKFSLQSRDSNLSRQRPEQPRKNAISKQLDGRKVWKTHS